MSNFEKAVALDVEKWTASLPDEFPDFECSESYIKFRSKLIDKMRNDKYHRFTKKATIFIIVAAVLLSMTIVTLAATVGKDFIIQHFKGYAEVKVSDVENAEKVNDFSVGYVPDGFVKTDEDISTMGITYSFAKEQLWFNITKNTLNSGLTIDEENSASEELTVGNNKYLISYSEETITMMWNDGSYVYYLTGNLEKDKLIMIAKNAN